MAQRPFKPGVRNLSDMLNDLYNVGIPRIRLDPLDEESDGTNLTVDRQLRFEDNGVIADVLNSLNLTFAVSTLQDGWAIWINVRAGTATINVSGSGALFQDGTPSKTITANNGALISCTGTAFRIFRFATN